MKTGVARLPLHGGKAPLWLFSRMKFLVAEIAHVILYDFGTSSAASRPFFFMQKSSGLVGVRDKMGHGSIRSPVL